MPKTIQTVFKRKEKKYLVTAAQYERLLPVLQKHMQPDAYGAYTICNVYFDTEHDDLIRRSLEKPVFKEKLRARSYGVPSAEDKVFLEIKRKYKGVVYKRRVAMTYAQLQAYLATGEHPPKQTQVFAELDYFLQFYHPAPKLYLSYDRLAFQGREDASLRITFDSDIRSRTTQLHLSDGDFGELLLPRGVRVMEIKSDLAMPLWLCDLLTEQGVYPTSFSKYGKIYMKNNYNQGA